MDDGGAAACTLVLFFALLLIEAILYGFSKAIYLMNEKEIERRAQEENDKKSIALLGIVQHSTIYVNSIQMITTLIDLVMGCFYLPIWINCFTGWLNKLSFLHQISDAGIHIIAVFAATFCLMYVMLTFGTLLPRKLAQKYPDAWAYIFIGHIGRLKTVLYPLTGIVAVSTNALLRVMGLRTTDEQSDVTEEEIISMVNEGHEQGVLEASEAEMITNIFEFGDKKASDIMTHRNSIIALDSEMLFKDALVQMLQESNSRYPVYEENLDHIIGVLYLKDAMRLHTSDESLNRPIGKVQGLVRKAVFVPETKNIDDLFKSMQSQKNQMVIVMDEYGQTSGLVTMEDILEEIVGNIFDEYDDEEVLISRQPDGSYIIDGQTLLEDIEDAFDMHFDCEDIDTINGYLIYKMGKIPQDNEQFECTCDGYSFRVLEVHDRMVTKVGARREEERQQPVT